MHTTTVPHVAVLDQEESHPLWVGVGQQRPETRPFLRWRVGGAGLGDTTPAPKGRWPSIRDFPALLTASGARRAFRGATYVATHTAALASLVRRGMRGAGCSTRALQQRPSALPSPRSSAELWCWAVFGAHKCQNPRVTPAHACRRVHGTGCTGHVRVCQWFGVPMRLTGCPPFGRKHCLVYARPPGRLFFGPRFFVVETVTWR